MSYILDALKKADKERKRGSVPDLSTVQDPTPQKPKKRSLWPYLVVAALLINVVIFLFWLRPWEPEETHTIAKAPLEYSPENKSYSAVKSTDNGDTVPSVTSSPQEKSPHEIQSTIPLKKPVDTQNKEHTIPMHTKHEDELIEKSSKKQPAEPAAPSTTTPRLPSTEPTTSDKPSPAPHTPPESRFML